MPYSSRIPAIVAGLEFNLARVVNRTGLRIEAGAKRRARVDTGYMRRQIRWYPGQHATGYTGNEDDPVALEPSDALSGEVVGGADYTIYNEYGTAFMSAQPMFVPASEEAQAFFIAELTKTLKKAIEG